MPKILMLGTAAGPDFSFTAGREYDVTPEVARELIRAGAAEWAFVQVEQATEAPTETAVTAPAKKSKRARG